ncbi:MAG: hypothetical protein WD208_02330 [Dehalococcoidia bacterium]
MTEDRRERQQPEPVGRFALWFALAAPVVIWVVFLNVGYVLIGMECYWSIFPFSAWGLSGLRLVLIGMTVLSAVGIILASIIGLANWRAVGGERGPQRDPTGRYRFMVIAGLILSGIFFLQLVWSSVHIILTDLC